MNGLVNCNIDGIKTCNNDNIAMKSVYLYFNEFPLFLAFLLIFMNTQVIKSAMRCHGNHALSHSPYHFFRTTSFRIEGVPMNNLARHP